MIWWIFQVFWIAQNHIFLLQNTIQKIKNIIYQLQVQFAFKIVECSIWGQNALLSKLPLVSSIAFKQYYSVSCGSWNLFTHENYRILFVFSFIFERINWFLVLAFAMWSKWVLKPKRVVLFSNPEQRIRTTPL
jgi:predicted AlkP superfamily pyrophosphatase or phosphodiesterase